MFPCSAPTAAAVVAAWGLLLAGQLAPLVALGIGDEFFSSTKSFSFWGGLHQLLSQESTAGLGWFLLVWSGILPHVKLMALIVPFTEGVVGERWARKLGSPKALRFLGFASRAAFVDVFMLALVLSLVGGEETMSWGFEARLSLGDGPDYLLCSVVLLTLLFCREHLRSAADAKATLQTPPALPGSALGYPAEWSVRGLGYGTSSCAARLLLDFQVFVWPMARLLFTFCAPVLNVDLSSSTISSAMVETQPSTIAAQLGAVWRNGSPAFSLACICFTVLIPLLDGLHLTWLVLRSAGGPAHDCGLERVRLTKLFCALDLWLLAMLVLSWQGSSGGGSSSGLLGSLVAFQITILPAGIALAAMELVLQPILHCLMHKAFKEASTRALAAERLPLLQ